MVGVCWCLLEVLLLLLLKVLLLFVGGIVVVVEGGVNRGGGVLNKRVFVKARITIRTSMRTPTRTTPPTAATTTTTRRSNLESPTFATISEWVAPSTMRAVPVAPEGSSTETKRLNTSRSTFFKQCLMEGSEEEEEEEMLWQKEKRHRKKKQLPSGYRASNPTYVDTTGNELATR
jgi:hypothetical protein